MSCIVFVFAQCSITLPPMHTPSHAHTPFHAHRLWLSTVKSCVVTSGLRVDFDLSVASAELLEYLYRNQTQLNTITKPVSISPVSQATIIFKIL